MYQFMLCWACVTTYNLYDAGSVLPDIVYWVFIATQLVSKLELPEETNSVPDESAILISTVPEADAPLCSHWTVICCGCTLKGIFGDSQ